VNSRPVDIRARGVNAFVLRKLAKLERHLILSQGYQVVGPLQQRRLDLGGCRQLFVGAYGGVNRDWHDLIERLADSAAPSRWSYMLCKRVSDAAGVLRQCEQRRLCFTMARERSRLWSSRLMLAPDESGPASQVPRCIVKSIYAVAEGVETN